jgi:hypothetical protein
VILVLVHFGQKARERFTTTRPQRIRMVSTKEVKWVVRSNLLFDCSESDLARFTGWALKLATLPYVVRRLPARKVEDQDGGLILKTSNRSSRMSSRACGEGY